MFTGSGKCCEFPGSVGSEETRDVTQEVEWSCIRASAGENHRRDGGRGLAGTGPPETRAPQTVPRVCQWEGLFCNEGMDMDEVLIVGRGFDKDI